MAMMSNTSAREVVGAAIKKELDLEVMKELRCQGGAF